MVESKSRVRCRLESRVCSPSAPHRALISLTEANLTPVHPVHPRMVIAVNPQQLRLKIKLGFSLIWKEKD